MQTLTKPNNSSCTAKVLVQQKFLYSKSSCTTTVLVQQQFLYSNSSCTATFLVQQQILYSNSSCTATVQHYIHPLMYFNKVMMSEHYTVTMVKLTFKHCFFHRICSAFEQIFTFKLKQLYNEVCMKDSSPWAMTGIKSAGQVTLLDVLFTNR